MKEKEKIKEKFIEEIQKYLEQEKEKKAYSVYLTKEDVEFVKSKLKVPLSRYLDEMVRMMAMTFKKTQKEVISS
jgi:hypothetical protein